MRALILLAPLALAACGGEPQQNEGAADGAPFAQDPNAPQTAPRIATPLPGAAPGPMERGTQTDPQAAGCGAVAAADYLGLAADEATRATLADVAVGATEIRFVMPGDMTTQDNLPNRLNVMLDQGGVIRDLRCG